MWRLHKCQARTPLQRLAFRRVAAAVSANLALRQRVSLTSLHSKPLSSKNARVLCSTDKTCGERCLCLNEAWRCDYAARLFGKSIKASPTLARSRANLSE